MFKIGEFSKLSHVTVKTIRYYDQIGLLEPARVDPNTGYRYYSARQLPRLNRILALKGLGLSLEQIRELLDEELPPDQIRGMLRLKELEIRDHIQKEQNRLNRVEQVLRQIEKEEQMPAQQVSVKSVPALRVCSLRDTIPTYSAVGELFEEMFAFLGKNRLQPAGPPVGLYHDPEYQEQDPDVEIAVPVSGSGADSSRIEFRKLPAVDEMACTFHEGGYGTIGAAYSGLMEWIEDSGCQIAGPVREVYLRGPESGEEASYLTEIQVPVSK